MILVTGGSGFMGSLLLRKLLSDGHKVACLSRSPPSVHKGVKWVKADVTEPASLKKIPKGIDAVAHLAGIVSYSKPKDEIFRINAGGTANIIEACRQKGIERIVLSSSVSVYAPIRKKDVASEKYPAKPSNHYGRSKLEAERLVSDSGMDSVILRIAPVYGRGSPSWVKALRLLDGGFPIPSTKNLTHVVHVSDAVQAFAKALDRGSGTCNIADREPVRFVGFAESILSELGRQPKKMPPWLLSLLVGFTSMKTYYKTLVANRNYDISRARRQLLFSPKAGMAEGIRDMVEWYREEFGGSATAER